jgi:hypothetical protein
MAIGFKTGKAALALNPRAAFGPTSAATPYRCSGQFRYRGAEA